MAVLMMDLKILIGTHAQEGDDFPVMDNALLRKAQTLIMDWPATLKRDMTTAEWYWWRTCEHIQEVLAPTFGLRDWIKLEPTDEDEPRVVETCEAKRDYYGGPCETVNALRLCQQVSGRMEGRP